VNWNVEQRAWLLSLLVFLVATTFAAFGVPPRLSGGEWIGLMKWLIGLNLAGSAGLAVARPFGEVLAARAAQFRSAK
jgi:hypothetical protein